MSTRSTSGSPRRADTTIVWYRKHFTIGADQAGKKVFFERERIRQAATVFVNGARVVLYEGGVIPFGFDITNQVRFGADNVNAVQTDDSASYAEKATGQVFQWDSPDFTLTATVSVRSQQFTVTKGLTTVLPDQY